MIPTARHVEYALGYMALNLLDEAAAELEAVRLDDRFSRAVLTAQILLHTAAGRWELVANFARGLIALDQTDVSAWISLGCAVRRTESIAAARDVLRPVETTLGATNAVIHFNLACYCCLLGETEAARRCLERACELDAGCKAAALDDPDLETMWAQIAAMK